MTQPPPSPKLLHITHVDNLASIVSSGELLSDTRMRNRGGPAVDIGMTNIKTRRLALPVRCHPGDTVGDYVPFFFCARSVMLFVIHKANHPDLQYRGGQDPIVHLEADLTEVVDWAQKVGRKWAFSSCNASASYASFWATLGQLSAIDWDAIQAHDFREPDIKEGKQAEFLIHGSCPFERITRIGVRSAAVRAQAESVLREQSHRPRIEVQPGWYY